jgi:phosphoadenosine phosphosulfate reductase
MKNLISELDLTILSEASSERVDEASGGGIINYYTSGTGYIPCDEGGLSLEGVFDRKLDIEKVGNILNILGEVITDKTYNSCSVKGIVDVYGEGAVVVKGKSEQEIDKRSKIIRDLIIRALECVGCGVCQGRCELGAIEVDGRIYIDAEKCLHCSVCIGPCPVVDFGVDHEYSF